MSISIKFITKVLGIVKNSNDAEDIAQDVFVLVYIKIYLNSEMKAIYIHGYIG